MLDPVELEADIERINETLNESQSALAAAERDGNSFENQSLDVINEDERQSKRRRLLLMAYSQRLHQLVDLETKYSAQIDMRRRLVRNQSKAQDIDLNSIWDLAEDL